MWWTCTISKTIPVGANLTPGNANLTLGNTFGANLTLGNTFGANLTLGNTFRANLTLGITLHKGGYSKPNKCVSLTYLAKPRDSTISIQLYIMYHLL